MSARTFELGGRMHARRWRVVVMVVLVVVGGAGPGVAGAASKTTCTFEYDVEPRPTPGSPGTGTTSSGGERGTIQCQGPVQGYDAAGQGSAGFDGSYNVDSPSSGCRAGSGRGDGVQSFTIPTAGGDQHVENHLTYTYKTGIGGAQTGEFRGDRMTGRFEFRPIDGNCSTRPVRRFHVTGRGTLR